MRTNPILLLAAMLCTTTLPARADDMAGAMDPAMDHSRMQHTMTGMYGGYSMTREASGTSWQPDSSPHEGIMGLHGDWTTMIHGFANLIHDDQGGPRGETKNGRSTNGQERLSAATADGRNS